MEREPDGGTDVGRDLERELGDDPPASLPRRRAGLPRADRRVRRRSAATRRRPSRRRRPRTARSRTGRTPATSSTRPSVRSGPRACRSRPSTARRSRRTPPRATPSRSLDVGPAGLPVVYTIDAGAFDIIVNGDHLLSWGVEPSEVQDAALRNLARWSATAPWTDEVSGERRLISSDTGRRLGRRADPAARRRRPPVGRARRDRADPHRAARAAPDDGRLAAARATTSSPTLFAEFIVEQSGGADEPIDRRVFELVDGRLVEFAGV